MARTWCLLPATTNTIADGEIWVKTDVYKVRLPLPEDCDVLVYGEVLTGTKQHDKAVSGKLNDPMMPVAWTNSYHGERVFRQHYGRGRGF